MMRYLFALLVLVKSSCLFAQNTSLAVHDLNPTLLAWGDFNSTLVYTGEAQQHIIVLLTDRSAWYTATVAASELAAQGNIVSVLNIDVFFRQQQLNKQRCFDIATPLSVYAQDLQQKFHVNHFQKPLVIGNGSAANVVQAMFAKLPSGIFQAGFSVFSDTSPRYLPGPLCHAPGDMHWQSPHTTIRNNPVISPATPWSATYRWLMPTSTQNDWLADFHWFITTTSRAKADAGALSIDDLPLIELPVNQPDSSQDFFAIIISGDGGWANIDKDIGNAFTARGIHVVGWNSLNYFWEGKNPDIAGADLARVITHYRQQWQLDEVLLIGYSMGADVLPFMANQLTPELKSHLRGIQLLNPSTRVDFTFHLSGWFNPGNDAPYELAPEIPRLANIPLLCIYSEDDDSLCPTLTQTRQLRIIHLPGDHHFNGDYETLVHFMLDPLLR